VGKSHRVDVCGPVPTIRSGRADEVDRPTHVVRRQFGRLKDGARDQRGLMPTGIALRNLVFDGMQDAVCRGAE
jgi:hypothetical protein